MSAPLIALYRCYERWKAVLRGMCGAADGARAENKSSIEAHIAARFLLSPDARLLAIISSSPDARRCHFDYRRAFSDDNAILRVAAASLFRQKDDD